MEVKICGLTKEIEARYLTTEKYSADYAGFVFYEKSKRYISFDKANVIRKHLHNTKSVAVTVSPDVGLVSMICDKKFDVLQVHGELSLKALDTSCIPIWYAFNVADSMELEKNISFIKHLPDKYAEKIQGIVVDSAKFGSGRTFEWSMDIKDKLLEILNKRKFILAGGLNADNLLEGIKIFQPDVVDVSSGVENKNGKDKNLVKEFIDIAKGEIKS